MNEKAKTRPFVRWDKGLHGAILRARMSCTEKVVTLAIGDRTIGHYGRSQGAPVSVSLLATLTNLHPTQVKRCRSALIRQGVIQEVAAAKGSRPAILRIDPDASHWGFYSPFVADTQCDHKADTPCDQEVTVADTLDEVADTPCDQIADTPRYPLKISEEGIEEGRPPVDDCAVPTDGGFEGFWDSLRTLPPEIQAGLAKKRVTQPSEGEGGSR